MPNRIIKESICYSEDIDQLKPFEETVFYRLIVNCDDYGRIDARISFLKSKLFVTKQGITNQNVEDAILKLASVGLVNLYDVGGKPYLLFPKWELHQQIRAKKSKYPAPDKNGYQMISEDNTCHRNPIQSESESESKSESNSAEGDLFQDRSFSDAIKNKIAEWLSYKTERRENYKPTGLKSLLTQIENKLKIYPEDDVIALIGDCMACNYTGIIWDKLSNRGDNNGGNRRTNNGYSDGTNQQSTGTVQKPKYGNVIE